MTRREAVKRQAKREARVWAVGLVVAVAILMLL